MKRDEWLAAGLWLVLTVIGEIVVWNADIFPGRYAGTADVVDSAFLILTRLAVPVFAFVVSVLLVSLLRFRAGGEPGEEGAPFRGDRRIYAAWLGVTGSLAVLLIAFPGLSGLAELDGSDEEHEDLVVEVEAARWAWTITYPDAEVTTGDELVLPEGRLVKFVVTSVDILHSFWIPAFRVKIDAVPGRITYAFITPERPGSFEQDPALRIQCAELCGLAHSTMALPVRVLPAPEFDAWLAEKGGAVVGPACEPKGTELHITAEDIAFDTHCLAAPADTPFSIVFEDRDGPEAPHNVSIAADEGWTDVLFTGEIIEGPRTVTYQVPALPAGTHRFRCDVHPIPAMSGTFVVARVREGG